MTAEMTLMAYGTSFEDWKLLSVGDQGIGMQVHKD